MHDAQAKVSEFHREMGLETAMGKFPKWLSEKAKKRRLNLIVEELDELVDALNWDNKIEAIDALCDLLYVIYGTAVEMGVDLQPFFDEVHESNMTKIGGHKRESDGKWIKPDDYSPPDLKGIFELLYGGRYDTESWKE